MGVGRYFYAQARENKFDKKSDIVMWIKVKQDRFYTGFITAISLMLYAICWGNVLSIEKVCQSVLKLWEIMRNDEYCESVLKAWKSVKSYDSMKMCA